MSKQGEVDVCHIWDDKRLVYVVFECTEFDDKSYFGILNDKFTVDKI